MQKDDPVQSSASEEKTSSFAAATQAIKTVLWSFIGIGPRPGPGRAKPKPWALIATAAILAAALVASLMALAHWAARIAH